MATSTMTPEEALRHAFDEVDRTNRLVEDQRKAQAEAQKQVEKASAFQTATQLQLKNAEAKYRVLSGSVELAAPDIEALLARSAERERELGLTLEELQVAEVEAENARRARLALEELTGAQRDWLATATDVALILSRSARQVEDLPAAAPARQTCGTSLGTCVITTPSSRSGLPNSSRSCSRCVRPLRASPWPRLPRCTSAG